MKKEFPQLVKQFHVLEKMNNHIAWPKESVHWKQTWNTGWWLVCEGGSQHRWWVSFQLQELKDWWFIEWSLSLCPNLASTSLTMHMDPQCFEPPNVATLWFVSLALIRFTFGWLHQKGKNIILGWSENLGSNTMEYSSWSWFQSGTEEAGTLRRPG